VLTNYPLTLILSHPVWSREVHNAFTAKARLSGLTPNDIYNTKRRRELDAGVRTAMEEVLVHLIQTRPKNAAQQSHNKQIVSCNFDSRTKYIEVVLSKRVCPGYGLKLASFSVILYDAKDKTFVKNYNVTTSFTLNGSLWLKLLPRTNNGVEVRDKLFDGVIEAIKNREHEIVFSYVPSGPKPLQAFDATFLPQCFSKLTLLETSVQETVQENNSYYGTLLHKKTCCIAAMTTYKTYL
jgi:hypothetical protein